MKQKIRTPPSCDKVRIIAVVTRYLKQQLAVGAGNRGRNAAHAPTKAFLDFIGGGRRRESPLREDSVQLFSLIIIPTQKEEALPPLFGLRY